MINIVSFSHPRYAQAFIDYMATQQIHLILKQQEDEAQVWLEDESQQQRVEIELKRFVKEPGHPRYRAASWEKGDTELDLNYPQYPFLDRIRQQAGPVTLVVMVLCIAVQILMWVWPTDNMVLSLFWPQTSEQSLQVWRYFSHALLHFSLLHITFNLLWWWYLGGPLEKVLGSGKLFTLAIVAALFSGWAQAISSGVYFGGLSGVVYALVGYVWLYGERTQRESIYLPRQMMIFFVVWLGLGYFNLFGMSIANAAHLAGLILGLLMAAWDTRHRPLSLSR